MQPKYVVRRCGLFRHLNYVDKRQIWNKIKSQKPFDHKNVKFDSKFLVRIGNSKMEIISFCSEKLCTVEEKWIEYELWKIKCIFRSEFFPSDDLWMAAEV